MKKLVKLMVVLLLLIFIVASLEGCAQKNLSQSDVSELSIIHAGSLAQPLRQVEDEFNKTNTLSVIFKDQSAGSIETVKAVSELHQKFDIVVVADYTLIAKYLFPDYVDWYIQFATNKLVLAYTDKSKFAKEINVNNWYEILQRKGVEFGFADPNADPCGYRTLLMFQLAEKYYNRPSLYGTIVGICPKNNIKSKSVELISLLQSGELDYAFEYQSVAVQNNLKFMELPPKLDFSNTDYASFYSEAMLTLKDGTVVKGMPIVYGITIPRDAEHRALAEQFVAFLLSDKGKEVFEKNGQPFVPFKANIPVENLPNSIKDAIQKGQ